MTDSQQLFIFCLAAKHSNLTFAPRSRAAVARWAHNPKVGSSILPFATEAPPKAGFFLATNCTNCTNWVRTGSEVS